MSLINLFGTSTALLGVDIAGLSIGLLDPSQLVTINGQLLRLNNDGSLVAVNFNGATVDGTNLDDTVFGITGQSNFLIGRGGNDVLTGAQIDDVIMGGDGNDTLRGLAGNDVLQGEAGADLLDGGDGYDYTSYANATRGMIIDLAARAADDGDTFVSIEGSIGSNYNDIVFGSSESNIIFGSGGTDVLYGFAGDDIIDGGSGADQINGGSGSDFVSFVSSSRGVIADLAVQMSDEGDIFSSIESFIGSNFNDSVFGSSGDNILNGGRGGSDRLYGFGGSDTVSYEDTTRSVIIDLFSQLTSDGVDLDQLFSVENAIGSIYNDTVFGGAENNVIAGGGGDDLVFGYGGSDTFVLNLPGQGVDTIGDFTTGVDKISLAGYNFSGPIQTGVNYFQGILPLPLTFQPTLVHNTLTGDLIYDPDGLGLQESSLIARVGTGAIAASDFVLS